MEALTNSKILPTLKLFVWIDISLCMYCILFEMWQWLHYFDSIFIHIIQLFYEYQWDSNQVQWTLMSEKVFKYFIRQIQIPVSQYNLIMNNTVQALNINVPTLLCTGCCTRLSCIKKPEKKNENSSITHPIHPIQSNPIQSITHLAFSVLNLFIAAQSAQSV